MPKTLTKSKIGYDNERFGNTGNRIPIYGWNPFGFGCSNGCPDCWARKLAKRMKCEKCRNFEVHIHPERLHQSVNTAKGRIILCNFCSDTFDGVRQNIEIQSVLGIASVETRHTYIWLTQNAICAKAWGLHYPDKPNWYWGLTIRKPDDLENIGEFLQIPGKRWLSIEPLQGAIKLGCDKWRDNSSEAESIRGMYGPHAAFPLIRGVIVGHNKYKGAPGTETLEHIRSVVNQCNDAGVNVYVKQIWHEGKLCKNSDEFPEDLRIRKLPWEDAFDNQLTQHGGCDETETKK